MKTKKILKHFLAAFILFGVCFTSSSVTSASAPYDFGHDFGLIVHLGNMNRVITRAKAAEVLRNYFNAEDGDELRRIDLPESPLDQKTFLLWFFEMKKQYSGEDLADLYPEISDPYRRAWLESRHLNLLAGDEMTYWNLREFLYRHKTSLFHGIIPYFTGLVLSADDINLTNYPDPETIETAAKNLFQALQDLRVKQSLGSEEKALQENLVTYHNAFKKLAVEYQNSLNPVNQIGDLPLDIAALIKENGLTRILGEYSYNYSGNEYKRRYNLITGAKKFSGRIFNPGEDIDFFAIAGDRNWLEFLNGNVIEQNELKLSFGGGLSGTATMIFIPSWRAGLQIVKRYAHSQYFTDLYDPKLIGLDATIYRPVKNLVIKNNTESPVLFYIKDDASSQTLTTYIIGTPHYRRVEIQGPLKTSARSFDWIRRFLTFDGKIIEESISTTYDKIHE
jgi:hypothetical protein